MCKFHVGLKINALFTEVIYLFGTSVSEWEEL